MIPGSDLCAKMLEKYPTEMGIVSIIGGQPGDLEYIHKLYGIEKGLQVIPSYGFINNDGEITKIVDIFVNCNFDTLLVCVGSPQQELVTSKIINKKKKGVYLCLGASLDFILGRESRAPKWMQKISLEWFYRFIVSPRRMFKRYFVRGLKIISIVITKRNN